VHVLFSLLRFDVFSARLSDSVARTSSKMTYTVGSKKGANLFLSVTLSKINGF